MLPLTYLSMLPPSQEQRSSTATTSLAEPPAAVQDEVPSALPEIYKRYLWKHPNREARVTLYADGKVSFTHLTLGRPIQECCPHGSWKVVNGILSITFHHMANTNKEREHIFLQYDDAADVWYLSGHFEASNAVDFAFLLPWVDRCEQGPPVIYRWN